MQALTRLRARAHHHGLHGHRHISRQRLVALVMVATGLARVTMWIVLLALYGAGVPAIRSLYASVAFVSLLSVGALLLTDWGQVAASLAQLTAADAHHDAESARKEVQIDFVAIEKDVAKLAEMQPGPEGQKLAGAIRERLHA